METKNWQINLQCSIELGVEEKDLTPIYFSLSQTYKDNKQYELAMEYSEKEFNVIKDNPAEVGVLFFKIIRFNKR